MLGSLTVARDSTKDVTTGPNNIIQLAFRGPVAEDCGKVLTALIESYQEFFDITYRNVSDQTLDLITKARDVLKTDLAEKEKKYLEFRRETPVFWKSKDGLNMQLERVGGIENKRTALLSRKKELEARIAFIENEITNGRGNQTLLLMERANQGKMSMAEKALSDQLLPLLIQEQKLVENLWGRSSPRR